MHPELGFEQHRPAARVEDTLRSFDMRVEAGVAGTGVVGIEEGNQTTPVVMLRFDTDALPISWRGFPAAMCAWVHPIQSGAEMRFTTIRALISMKGRSCWGRP